MTWRKKEEKCRTSYITSKKNMKRWKKKDGHVVISRQLLTSTGLPYNVEVMAVPLPPKFQVPLMDMYDRTRDPFKHLETFKAHMSLHGFTGEVACRPFPLALKEPIRVWFKSLVPGSIDSFRDLACLFLTQFMVSKSRRDAPQRISLPSRRGKTNV